MVGSTVSGLLRFECTTFGLPARSETATTKLSLPSIIDLFKNTSWDCVILTCHESLFSFIFSPVIIVLLQMLDWIGECGPFKFLSCYAAVSGPSTEALALK